MARILYILLLTVSCNIVFAQINVINPKGTKLQIDTSKWRISGTNIYNKNIGNVGIGNINPVYTLDVTGKLRVTDSTVTNSLRIINTASGNTTTDSLLVITPTTDIVKKLNMNSLPYWSTLGNTNITYGTHFLGTQNDIPVSFKSNNTTMFEIGRRGGPLNLVDLTGGLFPYNDPNSSVAYVRGTGGNSALQFEASGASFYKPIFFTDANGNFKMRGSSAATDFFELGSAGATNAGSLDFLIGDDGDEPMTFRKYNYSPVGYVEMMRMQGTGLNNTVRVGVNVNGSTPTSTFQVQGSVATAITTLNAATTLNDTHHTIILTANVAITLPAANTCTGRVYIIKKTAAGTTTVTAYVPLLGGATVTTLAQGVTCLQSDGSNWQRIQ